MGKPRLIILIRHAQSEGNKNREIHQSIPDHRVKLTPEGWSQAEEAGRRLRSMLKPDDTLQFYTSPYRRTRETTEGILRSLTSDEDTPSPFPRHTIKVWEEPRLREQDFGNFQPCAAAMERMWRERADYGHFFYRIPNGESAADAYDRVSGFNETLYRSFSEDDFASVCVLVTHGLMTRVFLMKWYHWSVEYFEDLRNVNHCEFVVMKRTADSGKYLLENELRTWSELKRRVAAEKAAEANTSKTPATPEIPIRKRWGGCADGCEHEDSRKKPRQASLRNNQLPPQAAGAFGGTKLQSAEVESDSPNEANDQTIDASEECEEAFPRQEPSTKNSQDITGATLPERIRESKRTNHLPDYMEAGRDFGGSRSGAATPAGGSHDEAEGSDYGFPAQNGGMRRGYLARPKMGKSDGEWAKESGMHSGARADALGDQGDGDEEDVEAVLEDAEVKDKSLRGSVY